MHGSQSTSKKVSFAVLLGKTCMVLKVREKVPFVVVLDKTCRQGYSVVVFVMKDSS